MMTKAVTSTTKNGGDDVYSNRLLSYLKNQFKEKIIRFSSLRQNVYLVETPTLIFILKGYNSYSKLSLQESFTTALRNEGFNHSYLFFNPDVREPLFFDGLYFGCIEYLHPHKQAFYFDYHKDRKLGIEIVRKFHRTTSRLEKSYRKILPKYNVFQKWRSRTNQFLTNMPTIQYYVKKDILKQILNWSEWTLEELEKNGVGSESDLPVILHGDLAHHNFFRTSDGELKIIDFDLISIGHEKIDYLQYANRILPFLDWSLTSLLKYKGMGSYINDRQFLHALAYPTDIMREWNRIIHDQSHLDERKLKYTIDLTVNQFYLRRQFYKDIKYLVK